MSKSHSDYLRMHEASPLGDERDVNLRVLHAFVMDAVDGALHYSGTLDGDEACALARRAYDLGQRVARQEARATMAFRSLKDAVNALDVSAPSSDKTEVRVMRYNPETRAYEKSDVIWGETQLDKRITGKYEEKVDKPTDFSAITRSLSQG